MDAACSNKQDPQHKFLRHTRAHTHTHTHTGNREVTVQVTLACYSRPGQVASCSHSNVGIHPLGGRQTKLRFLALPGSSIWPRLPLGAELRKEIRVPHGRQFARLILRLDNGIALLEHLMVHHQHTHTHAHPEFFAFFGGFQRGVFVRGANLNNRGRSACAAVAILNFAFLVREILAESYVNSKFSHSLRIYPYPMVWPLPRPWSETMVSISL